jgi:hypothetical protein
VEERFYKSPTWAMNTAEKLAKEGERDTFVLKDSANFPRPYIVSDGDIRLLSIHTVNPKATEIIWHFKAQTGEHQYVGVHVKDAHLLGAYNDLSFDERGVVAQEASKRELNFLDIMRERWESDDRLRSFGNRIRQEAASVLYNKAEELQRQRDVMLNRARNISHTRDLGLDKLLDAYAKAYFAYNLALRTRGAEGFNAECQAWVDSATALMSYGEGLGMSQHDVSLIASAVLRSVEKQEEEELNAKKD